MSQSWLHLLFLHWKWDVATLQRRLPAGLYIDTFDGHAWVGLVPFYMRNIRPCWCPSVPWVSFFLEMNLRTYVYDEQGRSGVWFFSLECNQPIAVWTARALFRLPYQHAHMKASLTRQDGAQNIHYSSQRRGDGTVSRFDYALTPSKQIAEPGTLEFFLLERYLLFSSTPQGIRCGQVHHRPYPMAATEVRQFDTRVLALNGLEAPSRPPDHIAGSAGVDVAVFPLTA
jgi:uncharacterized protein YqjF (DUF2071 family)